jgi:hydroxypyruvate isomerase
MPSSDSSSRGTELGLTRREMVAGAVAALALGGSERSSADGARRSGRLKQSVSRWPYAKIPLPEFCRAVKEMGLVGIDLLQPEEWPIVQQAGLVCSMGYPTKRDDFIARGFNDPANHRLLLGELERTIPLAAQAGVPNVIAMFGNRQGRGDAAGAKSAIDGLRRIAPLAQEHRVTICVELLNSKVDHPDYMGDHTRFGVDVIEGVGSPAVKLLYDIYHMQIMEGDVIRTIRDHGSHLAHFHTGGVPDRHEIDDSQELNYRAVARALVDRGFAGFVAHEFVPTKDPLQSLRQAVAICDV